LEESKEVVSNPVADQELVESTETNDLEYSKF
jgi:hypothetical protein